jgi:lipopolysaccharide exporter
MTVPGSPNGDRRESLGRRVTTAAAWMVAFRWIDRLVGLLSVAVLARLLSPDDFGIVGYAMLVIGFLELVSATSTDAELIRHGHADRSYFNAAWTMNCLRGFALTALMLALVQPASEFFHEPRLSAVMVPLAMIPLIQGFENVGIVEFRKQLNFDREFRFLLSSRILSTVATIGLAFALRSYWALVAGSLLRAVLRVILSYGFHPFRPRLAFDRIPQIFRFSRWMMLQNLAQGLYDRMPGFVIGREWGTSPLAFFNVAKEIADLSASEVRAPIRRALYPGLAKIASQRARVGEVLVSSTGMLALLTIPIPLGIALIADDVVPLFLGTQWLPTVEVLRPLCFGAAVAAIGTNSQLAYLALNQSHRAAWAASFRALMLAGLLVIVTPTYGIPGVAYAIAGMTCVMTFADYLLASRLLQIDIRRLLDAIWRPVTAALVMAAAVALLRAGITPANDLSGHAWSMVTSALLGATVYVTSIWALWIIGGRRDGAEKWLIALARERFARRARSAR